MCCELMGEFGQGGGRPGVDGDVWWEIDGRGELVGPGVTLGSENRIAIGEGRARLRAWETRLWNAPVL